MIEKDEVADPFRWNIQCMRNGVWQSHAVYKDSMLADANSSVDYLRGLGLEVKIVDLLEEV